MPKKPNILIIISDQQNIDSIAAYKKYFKHKAYGCHWVKTPNFDRLVREGYSFLESHTANPVSSPARSALFTGRYTTETGVIHNNVGIDQEIPNMGQWFENHTDYDRVYCGKWHAGGPWNYPDVEGNRKIPGFETIPVGVRGTGDFNDFQVAGALRGYIQNHDYEKPFLAVAGLMNPHDICYWTMGDMLTPKEDIFGLDKALPPLPPNFEFDFEDPNPKSQIQKGETEWKNYIHDYLKMIEKLDTDIGRLLEAVDSRKDDTLVIFSSDHGEGSGRHKRVQKWHPFEQSVKVPLIFYMPGKVKQNVQDQDNIISSIHIMPTVCDFAGISFPADCPGKSLKGIIEGKPSENLTTAIAEFQRIGRVVRHKDFKYVKYYEFSGDEDKPFVRKSDGGHEYFIAGRGRNRYKEAGKILLFNLKEDPWETKDLGKLPEYAGKLDEMEEILVQEFEIKVKPGTSFVRN